MGSSSFVGAFVGEYFSKAVPTALLPTAIALVLAYSGADLARTRVTREAPGSESPASELALPPISRSLNVGWEVMLGFAIGLLGGMVGVVLGGLRLPAMIKILRMKPARAAGTNLAIGLFTGVFGLLGHLANLEVDFAVLAVMGPAAMIGSYQGAKYTGRVSPETLRRAIGYVLLVLLAAMFGQAYMVFE